MIFVCILMIELLTSKQTIMEVHFKPVKRHNPQNPTEYKYYAAVNTKEVISFDELLREISDGSSLRSSDVKAVIDGLTSMMIKQLTSGRAVQFGELGTFSLSISSEGVEDIETVSAGQIKKSKILYRASAKLKRILKSIHFIKSE